MVLLRDITTLVTSEENRVGGMVGTKARGGKELQKQSPLIDFAVGRPLAPSLPDLFIVPHHMFPQP